ncbi:MAG: hypothetical protein ACYC96_16225 [Fimbriimonadaceae bacterium]
MLGFARQDDPANWSVAQWSAWRDAQIARILAPTYEANGEKLLMRTDVAARSAAALRFMTPALENPAFMADRQRAVALGDFVKFITAQHWMALRDESGNQTHALAMDVSDARYWSLVQRFTSPPSLLRSRAFLELMGHRETYKYAVNMIEAQNARLPQNERWLVLAFRGQFVASVDRTTLARLLVVAPNQPLPDGRKLDQWVSFAIARPDVQPAPVIRSVSVIAVAHDDFHPGTSQAYFTDFLREYDHATDSIALRPTFLMKPNPSQNCYDCHKSAVIPIRPKTFYRFDRNGNLVADNGDGEVLARTDRMVAAYGESNLGTMNSDAYGPSLGASSASASNAFIAAATANRPISSASFAAVRENMNCASCHESVGKLNYLLGVRSDSDVKSFEAKHGLVQSFIEQGFMPPGNRLSPDERHALWECVSKAYFDPATGTGAFVDWLKGRA